MRFRFPLLILLASGCAAGPSELAPLLGRWESRDPRFQGCAMTFLEDGNFVLDRGAGEDEWCGVQEVSITPAGKARAFRILYETKQGDESTLSLVLEESWDLRLDSRPEVVWRKDGVEK